MYLPLPLLPTQTKSSLTPPLSQRYNPTQPLSTPLVPQSSTIDFATRVAKILVRRVGKPVYVGSSAMFAGAVVEEEVDAVRIVVEGVVGLVEGKEGGSGLVNGVGGE